MARKSADPEIEVVSEQPENKRADESTGQQATDFITREEHDRVVKHLQNEISSIREDLEQRIQDLETVVSNPKAVQFGEFKPSDEFPDYGAGPDQPVLPLDPADQGDVDWYSPPFMR